MESPRGRAPLLWTPAMATGLLWQDHQHEGLLDKLHELHAALCQRCTPAVVGATLTYLECYVQNHFGIEEAYMERLQYPEREEHLGEHQRFSGNLEAIRKHWSAGTEVTTAVSLCCELGEWFQDHIENHDSLLGHYLLRHCERLPPMGA